MSNAITFGTTPPPPAKCLTCKQARWAWRDGKWICLNCEMPKTQDANPCVQWWGAGPDGATCGQCQHRRGVRMAKTYWKCDLRPDLTHGAKTDCKASWKACANFEPLELDARAQALQQRKETR